MKVYSLNSAGPEVELPVFPGTAEDLGGQVLEGSVRLRVHIDFQQDGMTAGVFEASAGKVSILFPFSEHATILEGEVTLTDEAGHSHTFKPGDSYFIHKGQRIIWDVKSPRVRKSFFHFHSQPDAAPPPAHPGA